ncbi:MAG: hypothetical protein R2883_08500 [Caldisericia bacterium]
MGNSSAEGPGLLLLLNNLKPQKTTKEEILEMEKRDLVSTCQTHPLRPVSETIINREAHTDLSDLVEMEEDSNVRVIGLITNAKRKKSKKGSMVVRFTIEDLTGSCPVIAFGRFYDSIDNTDGENIVVLDGRLKNKKVHQKSSQARL